jgi:hypothetical protein
VTGGFNPKGYKGKYSGKAGKNYYRNPQPGFGGSGGGGGKKGCPLFLLFVIATASAAGLTAWENIQLVVALLS